jgi:hypothetical protein
MKNFINASDALRVARTPCSNQVQAVDDTMSAAKKAIERACLLGLTSTAIQIPVANRNNVLVDIDLVISAVKDTLVRSGYRVAIARDVPFVLLVSWSSTNFASDPACPLPSPRHAHSAVSTGNTSDPSGSQHRLKPKSKKQTAIHAKTITL